MLASTDVLDAAGRVQTTLVLDAPLERDPPPFFGARSVVGVIRDPGTAVERVVVFSISGRQG